MCTFGRQNVCTFGRQNVCTFVTNFCVYCCDQFLCVLLVLPVHTYLYIRTCIAYLYLVPVYLYIRTCTYVPVPPYLYSVPVSRTCIPVHTYLYCVPWYLVPTLVLPLCKYLSGTLVRHLPWILHLQSYPNQPRVC
eukprot:SAG11_NODE_13935_length_632_cov_1.949343_1_plen_134_part_01